MTKLILIIPAFLLILAIGVSCSGSGSHDSPLTPSLIPAEQPDEIGRQNTSNRQLLAYYTISVNDDHSEFEIAPSREAVSHWNIIRWLEQTPCTDCFKILGLTQSGYGTLFAEIEISHPFDNPNLTAFDVRGIAMFDASHIFPELGLRVSDRTIGDGELVNADGFTALYNSTTTGDGPGGLRGYIKGNLATTEAPDSIINGYKRFNSTGPAAKRNAFLSGDSVAATFEIDMPDGEFVFGYAVDASWEPALVDPVTDPIADFPPEANCFEPWKIVVTTEPVGDGLTSNGGQVKFTIDVYDWLWDDQVPDPRIYCTELGLFDHTLFKEDFGEYRRYTGLLDNNFHAPAGEYQVLVAAWPEYCNYTESITQAAWQIVTVEVVPAFPNDLTPADLKGSPIEFHINGSYAYCTYYGGDSFEIWDVSNPLNPIIISSTETNFILGDFIVENGYAYIEAMKYGLIILDIDPPESPSMVNSVYIDGLTSPFAYNIQDIDIDAGVVVLAIQNAQAVFIDVDPPDEAEIIYKLILGIEVRMVELRDGILYSAVLDEYYFDPDFPPIAASYFVTYDLSTGNSDSIATGSFFDMVIKGDFAIGSEWDGLRIIDISDPSNIEDANYVWGSGMLLSLSTDENLLFATGSWTHFDNTYILDISDPLSVTELSGIPDKGATFLEIPGSGYGYLQSSTNLKVIDINPPEDMSVVSTVKSFLVANSIDVQNGFAYIGTPDSMAIVDVDPVVTSQIVSYADVAQGVSYIKVIGDKAYIGSYVSDEENWLYIYDISVPSSPNQVGSMALPPYLKDMDCIDGYVFAIQAEGSLKIYDVDPPGSPYLAYEVEITGIDVMQDLAVNNGYAYVVGHDSYDNLSIIDIDPIDSSYVVNVVANTPGYCVGVSDELAIVGLLSSDIQIIDINPAGSASVIATYSPDHNVREIEVAGNYFYYIEDYDNVKIVDIGDPSNPIYSTQFKTPLEPSPPKDLALTDGFVFVADGYGGLRIFQF